MYPILLQDPLLQQRFDLFHEANPAVYDMLCLMARNKRDFGGRKKLGMKQLFEVLRWDVAMTTNDPEFKLNNNFAPLYARLIMRQEPDLAGIFFIRRSVVDQPQQKAA